MARKGVEIIDLNVEELINDLNQAMAAEALAAYRYKLLSKWATGINSPQVAELFEEMSDDEWKHVGLFMERIVQLDGKPIMNTSDWQKHSYSTYKEPPKDPSDLEKMIKDSLEDERGAIEFYSKLYNKTQHADPVTAQMVADVLADEVEDEDNLIRLLGR
ncbi:MAG TPA: ferritin-like domain-containing protein [Thermodesulfobacteriota bacterium]|nr:ferritin-like domain-containing protein [Thermodesulfobacteriota bacterium]